MKKKIFNLLFIRHLYVASTFIFIFSACKNQSDKASFFLNEPSYISNYEADNSIEGTPLKIKKIEENYIVLSHQTNFNSYFQNDKKLYLGFGYNEPYYDTGTENIYELTEIKSDTLYLGKRIKGTGRMNKGATVVIWNFYPSGFQSSKITPVIIPDSLKGLKTKSLGFGKVIFDPETKKYLMFIQEMDTISCGVYLACSDNLIDWSYLNNGCTIIDTILKTANWGNRSTLNCTHYSYPLLSDIAFHNNRYYFFFYGYDASGKRNIGVVTSNKLYGDKYTVLPEAVIVPEKKHTSAFYPKITFNGKKYIMAYAVRSISNTEFVHIAQSDDLLNWSELPENPVISSHKGWRSAGYCSEPAFIEYRDNTLYLLVAGAKKFNTRFYHRYLTNTFYTGNKGNVNDQALGLFISYNHGSSFYEYSHNPVFTGDYRSPFESDHAGANFTAIRKDRKIYIVYQAKALYDNNYKIFVKEKSLH